MFLLEIFNFHYQIKILKINYMKTGTRNVVAEKEAIKSIEFQIRMFKRKRISKENFILKVNQTLSKMINSERDYIEYLQNIGQF